MRQQASQQHSAISKQFKPFELKHSLYCLEFSLQSAKCLTPLIEREINEQKAEWSLA